jgi:dihydroflavonol-4-reductase
MSSSRPKVLVTGASGFIGSRLVRQLVESGEQVKALVRASSSRKALAGLPASQVEIVEGDVMVSHTIYRALAGCDRMFHVAAMNKMWDRRPGAVVDAALVGTHETLEAARRRQLARVVYTSSIGVLGASSSREEMDESNELNLEDAEQYIVGKVKAEASALEFTKDFDVVVTMPAMAFGPGDYKPTPAGAMLLKFLAWNIPLIDFPVTEGGINVVDVDDVARGHVLAMEKGKSGERYILGGENLTIEQVFTLLAEITGLSGPGSPSGKGLAELVGRLSELRARLGGPDPEVTFRMARDYVGAYTWVTSQKAETELGYSHRSARRALARGVHFFLENGFVDAKVARRIRVDLRAPA